MWHDIVAGSAQESHRRNLSSRPCCFSSMKNCSSAARRAATVMFVLVTTIVVHYHQFGLTVHSPIRLTTTSFASASPIIKKRGSPPIHSGEVCGAPLDRIRFDRASNLRQKGAGEDHREAGATRWRSEGQGSACPIRKCANRSLSQRRGSPHSSVPNSVPSLDQKGAQFVVFSGSTPIKTPVGCVWK